MAGPTIIERQALGDLLDVLLKKGDSNSKWKAFIASWFADWNPIHNSAIGRYEYYKTLKEFPAYGKREIIRGVLLGWNEHHDTQILYDTINVLIYLKLCNTIEYFFVQQFCNFLISYSSLCKSNDQIIVEPRDNSFYTIRFMEEDIFSIGAIDFQLSSIGKDNVFCIVPWGNLLSAKTGECEDEILNDDVLPYIIENEIFPLLENEFAKELCPWITSSWDFDYRKEPLGRRIIIRMHSLYYEDNNGGY